MATLKSTAALSYLLHVSLTTCAATIWRLLTEKRLPVVRHLPSSEEARKKIDLSGKGMGECVHCCFTYMEDVHAEERIMLL